MNSPARNARPLRARAIAFAVSYLLLLAPLAAPAAHAGSAQKKKKKPAPMTIVVTPKDPAAVLRPNSGVTFSAKVFDRNGVEIEGGEVKWSATGSDAVGLTPAINEGTRHEVTVIGFTPEGRTPPEAIVEVTAILGTLKDSESVRFQPNVSVKVNWEASAPDKVGPGDKYTLVATVNDGTSAIPDAEVKWSLAGTRKDGFVELVPDSKNRNRAYAIGLKPKDNTKSGDIIAVATYGGASDFISIPHGEGDQTDTPGNSTKTAKVKNITVKRTGSSSNVPEADYDIEPGLRLPLKATVEVEQVADAQDPAPEPVWSVPQEMKKYIAKLDQTEQQRKDGEVVFYGLTPGEDEADAVPETLYVLVRAKDVVKAVPIRNGQQTVDVSWIILPPDVVTKNFGRSVSEKYYGIEVVVGNNSGHDLQLTGLSFEVDPSLMPANPSSPMLRRMPVASYEAVRGVTAQRKLSLKSRGTIIAGLDAAAQILTGFTPFFHVASRARNFSQGINILGNPVTKGIERVWPDPSQDELSRLEHQSLHDDKIIPNDSVFRTTVFFPRDVLDSRAGAAPYRSGGELIAGAGIAPNQLQEKVKGGAGIVPPQSREKLKDTDLMEIRRRLGQLILVGSKLNRNDFQLRVRQGFRTTSGVNE